MIGWVAVAGLPVVALEGIDCLRRDEGKNRRRLAWTAALLLGALALLAGGKFVLGFFGLAWRNAPAAVLLVLFLLSGCLWIGFTVTCVLRRAGGVLGGVIVFFAVVVFLVWLWAGLLILAFGFGYTERVIDYQGQTLVEVEKSWHHSSYYYYEYHGPLVRGSERIYYCERKPLAGG